MVSTCAFERPKTLSVGRPATTSRKWPDSRCSVRSWRSVWLRVAVPMSTMNTGIRGSVTAMMTAESQSWAATTARTVSGTITASTSCGR